MPFHLPAPMRRCLLTFTIGSVLTVLAACGSSGGAKPSASASPSPPATSSAPATGSSSAQAAIKANWVAFFSPKTPVSRRIALLQNGQVFAPVIRAQASSPLASTASATVSQVTLTSATQAKVTYTILVGGTPALANQAGVAVYQDGTWKVGDASFCGLLVMENNGKTSSLPAICKAGA